MEGQEVLVLSDDRREFAGAGFRCVGSRDEAGECLMRGSLRAVVLDRRSVDEALQDVRWLRRRRVRLPLLAAVDPQTVSRGVELLAAGVEEIVVREPHAAEALVARLGVVERRRASSPAIPNASEIVAVSHSMRGCLSLVGRAARSAATVLLEGETGTGKEVLARAIHAQSGRATGPFVAINCAAFPETLLESELFGYVRGAFTGAVRSKPGHFVEADGGTLFLDEVGETSLAFQAKLLRALQEGVVRPLGATREVGIDVRIIAAANQELLHEVEEKRFRRDLYYRLHVLPISVPPLRSRVEDVLPLARHFLARIVRDGPSVRIGSDAAHLLEAYTWPGNVRELENEIARVLATFVGETEVTASMLSARIQGLGAALPRTVGEETLRETMARLEAWVLRRALERHAGRRIATARSLGITRECLYKKLKKLGIG